MDADFEKEIDQSIENMISEMQEQYDQCCVAYEKIKPHFNRDQKRQMKKGLGLYSMAISKARLVSAIDDDREYVVNKVRRALELSTETHVEFMKLMDEAATLFGVEND